jgi:hypothetical protein
MNFKKATPILFYIVSNILAIIALYLITRRLNLNITNIEWNIISAIVVMITAIFAYITIKKTDSVEHLLSLISKNTAKGIVWVYENVYQNWFTECNGSLSVHDIRPTFTLSRKFRDKGKHVEDYIAISYDHPSWIPFEVTPATVKAMQILWIIEVHTSDIIDGQPEKRYRFSDNWAILVWKIMSHFGISIKTL